jgi:hypothetical protein
MNLYESIKSNLNESEDSDWEALKQGLSSCKSASDIEELMLETLSSGDYGRYCDYHYEIDDKDKSSLSWAKKELKKLADENLDPSEDDEAAWHERWWGLDSVYNEFATVMKNFLRDNNLKGRVKIDKLYHNLFVMSGGVKVEVMIDMHDMREYLPPYGARIYTCLRSKRGTYEFRDEQKVYDSGEIFKTFDKLKSTVSRKLESVLKDIFKGVI